MPGRQSDIFYIWAIHEASDSIMGETCIQVVVLCFLGLNLAVLGICLALIAYQLIY